MASDFRVGAVGADDAPNDDAPNDDAPNDDAPNDDAPKSPPRSANDGTPPAPVHAYAEDAEVADWFEFVSDVSRAEDVFDSLSRASSDASRFRASVARFPPQQPVFPHERDARGAPRGARDDHRAPRHRREFRVFPSFRERRRIFDEVRARPRRLGVAEGRRDRRVGHESDERGRLREHATRLRILRQRRDDIGVHLVQIYGFYGILRIDEGFAGPVRVRRSRADASLLVGSGTFAETRAGGVVSKKRGGKGRRDEIGASFDGARAVRPRDR